MKNYSVKNKKMFFLLKFEGYFVKRPEHKKLQNKKQTQTLQNNNFNKKTKNNDFNFFLFCSHFYSTI